MLTERQRVEDEMRLSDLRYPRDDNSQSTLRNDGIAELDDHPRRSTNRFHLVVGDVENGCVGFGSWTKLEGEGVWTDSTGSTDELEVSKGDGMREETGGDGGLTEWIEEEEQGKVSSSKRKGKMKRKSRDPRRWKNREIRRFVGEKRVGGKGETRRDEKFELTFPASNRRKGRVPDLRHVQESPDPPARASPILQVPSSSAALRTIPSFSAEEEEEVDSELVPTGAERLGIPFEG